MAQPDMASRPEIVHASKAIRRAQRPMRDALRALRILESSEHADVFGRYVMAPREPVDEDELLRFVAMARGEYPDQEIHVVVTARIRAQTEEE